MNRCSSSVIVVWPVRSSARAEPSAEAEKAAAAKAKDAADLTKAQDKAVANYKKNKGGASMAPSKAAKK